MPSEDYYKELATWNCLNWKCFWRWRASADFPVPLKNSFAPNPPSARPSASWRTSWGKLSSTALPGKVVLTDAGQVLFEYAEKLLNLRNDARESLVELRELQKGKLVIAANEFTSLYLLPVLAEFRRLHPMIKITVQRALGSHIPDNVLQHTAELGVLSYEPQEPHLHSMAVYLDELVLVVPPKHPLASSPEVSIRQLGAESFVAHIVSSPYREKVLQTFERHKTPLHMDLELPTLQAIKQFVAMGNGVALVPEISVETELARR